MLSMSNVANSSAAGTYYEKADDYYSQDRSPSVWSGKAAQTLGLNGAVQGAEFRAMLDGRLPSGVRLHHAGEGSGRRGGTDLTFSAPKSVSMQALIGGDTRLLQAHETAVSRALEHAEELAACRVTEDGITTRLITGNLVIAQFRHDLSRAADPQLHTHAVVINATQRSDGAWRALDNEPLYRHKMWLGANYRSELAKEVRILGYEVRVTHGDGRFELTHIDPVQVKAFSKRSVQIEQAIQEKGLTRDQATARQLQVAALQTRQSKEDLDRAALLKQWREHAAEVGINFQAPHVAKDYADLASSNTFKLHAAASAVEYAVNHLMEREAVVKQIDIERAAMERGTGETDLPAIRQAMEKSIELGELLHESNLYTTPAAQQRERDILSIENRGRGACKAMMNSETVRQQFVDSKLNAGQRSLVESVLTSRDRYMGIQGRAGTGKTTALSAVRKLVEEQGIKLVGVAPSAAARELAGSGIRCETLAALATTDYRSLDKKTLVVLDEAGMVSAGDMHSLFQAVEKANARVLLVGDTQQLKAVQAGRPFAQLQQAGMNCAELTEIQRQKESSLKAAVELAAAGKVVQSLEQLKSSVIEIPEHENRHRAIALAYTSLDQEERKATLVVAGTNLSREAINSEVRKELQLEGNGTTLTTLSSKNLTQEQSKRTVSYQAGEMVRADRDYKTLGMKRGDLAQVLDGPAGVVTLERADGQVIPPLLTTRQSRGLMIAD